MRLPTDHQTLHLSCGQREVNPEPEPKPKPKEYAVGSTTPNQHRPSTYHGVWCRYLPWGQSHPVPIPALGSVAPVCCCSSCCCCCCSSACRHPAGCYGTVPHQARMVLVHHPAGCYGTLPGQARMVSFHGSLCCVAHHACLSESCCERVLPVCHNLPSLLLKLFLMLSLESFTVLAFTVA